jgi:hypothetical protein
VLRRRSAFIALEVISDELGWYALHDHSDSESDDKAIMMKTNLKSKLLLMSRRKATSQASYSSESKTIAMLLFTTLKPREDTLESPKTAAKYNNSS